MNPDCGMAKGTTRVRLPALCDRWVKNLIEIRGWARRVAQQWGLLLDLNSPVIEKVRDLQVGNWCLLGFGWPRFVLVFDAPLEG